MDFITCFNNESMRYSKQNRIHAQLKWGISKTSNILPVFAWLIRFFLADNIAETVAYNIT